MSCLCSHEEIKPETDQYGFAKCDSCGTEIHISEWANRSYEKLHIKTFKKHVNSEKETI